MRKACPRLSVCPLTIPVTLGLAVERAPPTLLTLFLTLFWNQVERAPAWAPLFFFPFPVGQAYSFQSAMTGWLQK